MNVNRRNTDQLVLIGTDTQAIVKAGGHVTGSIIDCTGYRDLIVQVEQTSHVGAPVVGDLVDVACQFRELSASVAGSKWWITPQSGYLLGTTKAASIITEGTRALGVFTQYTGNQSASEPWRETRYFPFMGDAVRFYYTNGIVTAGVTLTFTVFVWGRKVK